MTIIEHCETEMLDRAESGFDLPMLETQFAPSPVLESTFEETPVTIGALEQMTENWEDLAACRTIDNAADLFFSEELSDIVAAKRICAECPVIAPCLEGAIGRAEPCGVWGGQLFANGRVLAQKRRRGRPPKVARPEDQLPVVPIPEHLQKLIA